MEWNALAPEARTLFWDEVRALLSSDSDEMARPIEYLLWSDFFENPDLLEEAWSALVTDDAEPKLLERILENSGPVPFPLKSRLYRRLLPDRRWHLFIYRSLLGSAFDAYGHINRAEARSLLSQLEIPDARDCLEQFNLAGITHIKPPGSNQGTILDESHLRTDYSDRTSRCKSRTLLRAASI